MDNKEMNAPTNRTTTRRMNEYPPKESGIRNQGWARSQG
jgi:hypothetical protein